MMSVDDTLMCSFQILKPADRKPKGYQYAGGSSPMASAAPATGAFTAPGQQNVPNRGFGAPTSTYSPAPAAAPAAAAANNSRPGTPPKGKVAAAPVVNKK